MHSPSPPPGRGSRFSGKLKRLNSPQMRTWAESVLTLVVSSAIQLASFILLARILGVTDYGVIVAVAVVVSIAGEFVGLGCGDAYIESVSTKVRSHAEAFGQALAVIAVTLVPVSILAFLANKLIFTAETAGHVVFALIVTELIALRFTALLDHISIAHRALRISNVGRVAFALLRLAFIAAASFLFHVRSIEGWWGFQVAYSAVVVAAVIGAILWRFGGAAPSLRGFDWGRGVTFAGNQVLRSLQGSVDRIAIGFVTGIALVGTYGTAQRLVQFSAMPIQAVLRITYPTMFEKGRLGIRPVRRYSYRLLPAVLALGLAIALVLVLAAQPLAFLLGPSFAGVVEVVWGLSLLPALMGLQFVLGDVLTGAGRNKIRLGILVVGVFLVAGGARLGLVLGGALGAALGAVAANAILVLLIVAAIEWLARREPETTPESPDGA